MVYDPIQGQGHRCPKIAKMDNLKVLSTGRAKKK